MLNSHKQTVVVSCFFTINTPCLHHCNAKQSMRHMGKKGGIISKVENGGAYRLVKEGKKR